MLEYESALVKDGDEGKGQGSIKGVAGSENPTVGTSRNFVLRQDPLPPLLPYMVVSQHVYMIRLDTLAKYILRLTLALF